MLCYEMPRHTVPLVVMRRGVVWCGVMSQDMLSCGVVRRCVMSCDVMWLDVSRGCEMCGMSCGVMCRVVI